MRHGQTRRRAGLLSTGLLLVLAVAAWIEVGPAQFGGRNTYVITSGISMEPLIHQGDLVVVRQTEAYNVGDIVAYHLTLKTIVLHRIVGRDRERFVMKGDNNRWRDSARPDPSQVVGKLWVHVPVAGLILQELRTPGVLAVLVFCVLVAVVLGRRRRDKERQRQGERSMNKEAVWFNGEASTAREERLALAAVVALASLVIAVIAFSRPLQRTGSAHVSYEQGGTFSYAASGPGSIYNDGRVTAGQPVYLRLVRNLDVGFDYRFSSRAPHSLHGTSRLMLEIGQDTGWTRTAQLLPETQFDGDRVSLSGSIPLNAVQAQVDAFVEQTGVKGKDYTLTIVPVVTAEGTVAGSPFQEVYSPRLAFRLDALQLVLDRPLDKADPLKPSQVGVVSRPRMEANVFSLLGIHIPVVLARIAALLSFVLASAVAMGLAWPALHARRADEPEQIKARYGSLLLNAEGYADGARAYTHVVELLNIDDLVKVAGFLGRMILHRTNGSVHQYLVADGETVYRYATPSQTAPVPFQERGQWNDMFPGQAAESVSARSATG